MLTFAVINCISSHFNTNTVKYIHEMQNISSVELPQKKEGKERKGKKEAPPFNMSIKVEPGQAISCLHSDNNNWFISGRGFGSENFKSTFAIFVCKPLLIHNVLSDRRMVKSQKTTNAMTLVLCG